MQGITKDDLLEHFPYETPRDIQKSAFEKIAQSKDGVIIECPTGEGKTGIGIAACRAASAKAAGPVFYVTPTKVLVEQTAKEFGADVATAYGRGEYACLYYEDHSITMTAEESPCYMLKCGHRVDQETGETEDPGATPCPYFQAKYLARKKAEENGIVVCTTAYFVMNRLLVKGWNENPPALTVIDEADRLAKVVRGLFEYTITDYQLKRAADMLKPINKVEARHVSAFRKAFMKLVQTRPSRTKALLNQEEIQELLEYMEKINVGKLEASIHDAMANGTLDPIEHKDELKVLQDLTRKIPRLITGLYYSVEDSGLKPLDYVIAFYYKEDDPEMAGGKKKARHFLTVRSYVVRGLIKKVFGPHVIAYSATIGDPQIYGFETGFTFPFASYESTFPIDHMRVYMPSNTPNLAFNKRSSDDLKKSIRFIVETAKRFADAQHRSLVVITSEEERQQVITRATAAGLEVVTYGNGMRPKEAAAKFVAGEGQILVGTAAQYSVGIDLPDGIAPVIFFLRPSYQRPDDPETQFEKKRFSEGHCWALWNWRVMMEALQVRGRNIRSAEDIGIAYFVSQQFRRFLYNALPKWLRPAYRGQLTAEQAVEDGLKTLST